MKPTAFYQHHRQRDGGSNRPLFVRIGLAHNSDKMIIGTLMNLVPGIAITNVMRDIIAGDLIAGLVKLTEALLVATAIALGAGMAITLSQIFF